VEISATHLGRLSMSATWTLLLPANGVGSASIMMQLQVRGKAPSWNIRHGTRNTVFCGLGCMCFVLARGWLMAMSGHDEGGLGERDHRPDDSIRRKNADC
jgi:hypothetical protein